MQSGGLYLLRGHLQKDWKDLPRRSLVWWAAPAPPFPVVPPLPQGWPGPVHVRVSPGRAQRRSLQGAGVVRHVSLPEGGAWDHLCGTRCNPSFSLLLSVPRRNPESPLPRCWVRGITLPWGGVKDREGKSCHILGMCPVCPGAGSSAPGRFRRKTLLDGSERNNSLRFASVRSWALSVDLDLCGV